ncbi:MAG: urease accessory protein UreD [Thermostichales cyanobacterium DRC_bins_46]
MPNWGRASLSTNGRRVEQFSCAPLQWLGPVDPRAERWVFYLRNPNGGLLHGDRHQIQIHLEQGTHLEIRSQGATRVHPGSSQQTLEIHLQPASSLILIPHPLIPGSDADFHQSVHIHLAPGSRLAFGDLWTAGRLGMGEAWQFQRLRNQVQIFWDGHLCWSENLDLRPHHTPWIASPSILGDYPCWGSLYVFGDWGQINWPEDETHWHLQRPQGQILRCVGYNSLDLWQSFQEIVNPLGSRLDLGKTVGPGV